jgi:hypothetical protein
MPATSLTVLMLYVQSDASFQEESVEKQYEGRQRINNLKKSLVLL